MHGDPELRPRLHAFFSDQLRQIVPQETKFWSQQQLVVEFGDPTDAILKCADEYKANLIVMGVKGAGSMMRAATHFGSTAHRVISAARAPVLSVRPLQQGIFQ
jgi:nucleotide-binding universal stress UspA family protein